MEIALESLFYNTTGTGNVANGETALFYNTTGNYNVANGESALSSNTTGTGNVANGYQSAQTLLSGSYNTFLGYDADVAAAASTTLINSTAIGNGAQVTASNQMVLGDSSVSQTLLNGNVGIGTTNPGSRFDIESSGTDYGTKAFRILDSNGVVLTTVTSDGRFFVGADTGTNSIMTITKPASGVPSGASLLQLADKSISGTPSLLIGAATGEIDTSFIGTTGKLAWGNTDVQAEQMVLDTATGNLGIGTTNPYSRLQITGPDTASTSVFAVVNSASTTEFTVYDTGNATLAGSLVQNSDERLKTNIQDLDSSSSLAEINALNPVTFNWIDPAKSSVPQFGFIAQQVQSVFPNLVSTTSPTALTPNGTLSLNYIDLISPIVAAIQELDKEITSLASTLAGFASSFTTNQLTFVRGQGNEIDVQTANMQTANVQKLCIGSTCVTEAQLQAVLAAVNQSGAPSSPLPSTSEATDTPPLIAINGDNPAIIQVGASYTDLGATVTGPQADLNLGIQTFLNGVLASNIVIDTASAATDTIDYVATDSQGLTSTSTRTVIVQAAGDPVTPAPPATSAAASSTTATSSVGG